MPEIEQFAFPPRLAADGTLATVEQGSGAEIAQRVHVLVLTPPGHLDTLPDFGLEDQAHLQGGADLAEIERQLDLHIPADGLTIAVEEDLDALNRALSVVDIRIGG